MDIQGYIRRVRKIPPLTKEQEIELAKIIHAKGDSQGIENAISQLVSANLYIVVQIALSLHRPTTNLDDLIAEGNFGLYEAIWDFDPARNVKLCTFASHRIRCRMRAFLARKLDDAEAVAITFDRSQLNIEDEDFLMECLRHLTPQEQRILQMHYMDGHKLANIGALLRMSGERVRQLREIAMTKIRQYMGRR